MTWPVGRVLALVHNYRELTPDAISTVWNQRRIGGVVADPLNLVMPDSPGAAFFHTVPLIVLPGGVSVGVAPTLGIAAVPFRVPLHDQLAPVPVKILAVSL